MEIFGTTESNLVILDIDRFINSLMLIATISGVIVALVAVVISIYSVIEGKEGVKKITKYLRYWKRILIGLIIVIILDILSCSPALRNFLGSGGMIWTYSVLVVILVVTAVPPISRNIRTFFSQEIPTPSSVNVLVDEKLQTSNLFDKYVTSVNDVTVQNNSLQTEINTLKDEISAGKTEFSGKFATFNNETTELNNKLAGCVASINEASDKVAAFAKEKSKVDQEIAGCVSSIKQTTEEITAINERYDRRFQNIESSLEKVSEKNAKLERKLAKLEEILSRSNANSTDEWSVSEGGVRRVLTIEGVEFAFRSCPPGDFMMGSPENEDGRDDDETQHNVTIGEGFWICETPTTQKQWKALGFKNGSRFKGDERPAEYVSKVECDAYVTKLNDRGVAPEGWHFALPTEEQWEYACRAGTTGATCGEPLDDCAWYEKNSGGETHDVGLKKPNKWGIFDMLGNVWEWTGSKYNGGSSFVFRGGGWYYFARFCRPAQRDDNGPTYGDDGLGFRCVLVRRQ